MGKTKTPKKVFSRIKQKDPYRGSQSYLANGEELQILLGDFEQERSFPKAVNVNISHQTKGMD